MNTLTIAVFACLAVFAVAKPSGLLGLGLAHGYAHGHLPLVGPSGVVGSNGAAGPTGAVNGHGAVGPNGEHSSLHSGAIIGAHHGAVIAAPALHSAAVVAPAVHGLGLGLGHLGHGAALVGHAGLGHSAALVGHAGLAHSAALVGHTGLAHGAVVAPHALGHLGLGHHGLW